MPRVEPISGTHVRAATLAVPVGPDSAVGRSLSIARESQAERDKALTRSGEQLRRELIDGGRQELRRPSAGQNTDQNAVIGLDVLA